MEVAWARDLGSSGLWSMMLEELGNFYCGGDSCDRAGKGLRAVRGEHAGLPLNTRFGKLFVARHGLGIRGNQRADVRFIRGAYAFQFGHVVLHGARLWRFAAFWAVMFLLVGFAEEFLFRGYTLFTLARGIRFWPAAIILSSTFGLIHLRNGGEQWAGALAAAAIGFFFCFTLRRTGSLWFAVGFHAAWDWSETFFYSVRLTAARFSRTLA